MAETLIKNLGEEEMQTRRQYNEYFKLKFNMEKKLMVMNWIFEDERSDVSIGGSFVCEGEFEISEDGNSILVKKFEESHRNNFGVDEELEKMINIVIGYEGGWVFKVNLSEDTLVVEEGNLCVFGENSAIHGKSGYNVERAKPLVFFGARGFEKYCEQVRVEREKQRKIEMARKQEEEGWCNLL